MPAYLVELPLSGGKTLIGASDSYVVFALNATDARAVAANHFSGDADALWNNSVTTVTEIIAGTTLPADYELEVLIHQDGGAGIAIPVVYRVRGGAGNLAFASAVVGDVAGASYSDDDVVTVDGGTFTRAATFRVLETAGAVDTVEVMDPGEYTILPTLDEMTTTKVAGGGDDNLTLDGVGAAEESYEVLLGQMVTLLNTDPEIAAAAVDMSEAGAGARLFTVAAIADDIGDSTLLVRLGAPHAGAIPSLIGAIVDEGIAGAVLTFALPVLGAATTVIPQVLRALKSGN